MANLAENSGRKGSGTRVPSKLPGSWIVTRAAKRAIRLGARRNRLNRNMYWSSITKLSLRNQLE